MFLLRADDAHGYALLIQCEWCSKPIAGDAGAVLASFVASDSPNGGFGPWTLHEPCARKAGRRKTGTTAQLQTRPLAEALDQLRADIGVGADRPGAGG